MAKSAAARCPLCKGANTRPADHAERVTSGLAATGLGLGGGYLAYKAGEKLGEAAGKAASSLLGAKDTETGGQIGRVLGAVTAGLVAATKGVELGGKLGKNIDSSIIKCSYCRDCRRAFKN